MHALKIGDRVAACMLIGIASALLISTFNPQFFDLSTPDDARTVLVPRILMILIIGFSLLILVRSFLIEPAVGFAESPDWKDRAGWARLIASVVVVVVAAAMLRQAGFYISMVGSIFLLGAVMGYRKWVTLACVSLIAPALAWYIIVQVAELNLPKARFLSSAHNGADHVFVV